MAGKTNNKGRAFKGTFSAIPHSVQSQEKYKQLSAHARMLLLELLYQYKGFNNGDLCATWSMMAKRGFRSRATLHKSINELMHAGMIQRTRQGGRHCPSLYGVTWLGIDECKHPKTKAHKLDVRPSPVPSGAWKDACSMQTPCKHEAGP